MGRPDRPWHSVAVDDALEELGTDGDRGLAPDEAARRQEQHGKNAVPGAPPPNPLLQLLHQFADPLVGALLVAAIIAAVVASSEGEPGLHWAIQYSDTIAILLIVILNAALGFVQERRAAAALSALQKMTAPLAKVVRGGDTQVVPASELTLGDVVVLDAGDSVPADLRLVSTVELASIEGALTGESTLVDKVAETTLDPKTVVADRRCMAYMGTSIGRGHGKGVVVSIGAGTELGRIGAMIGEAKPPPTPLEKHLHWFGRVILIVCLALSALLFAIGMIRGTGTWEVMLLTAVSLAVAAIPEGLPAITTITLGMGMLRMAERGAIIRKLPAVETLGSASVICTDKTGTLTQNEMTVRIVETLDDRWEVSGIGYTPEGEFSGEAGTLAQLPEGLLRLLKVGVICDTAELRHDGEGWMVVGDPTEGALLALAGKGGLDRPSVMDRVKVEREIPFSSERQRMTVVFVDDEGRRVTYMKGSPKAVLEHCTLVRRRDGVVPLTDDLRQSLRAVAEDQARDAMRVIALAELEEPDPDDPERDLVFLGFAGMSDPPRPGVRDAIQQCLGAGIRVIMITGDHARTAHAIAQELGFADENDVTITGQELGEMEEAELDRRLEKVRVFARVSPDQKLRVVNALGRAGYVVAVTGDGVNDAPALRAAPIGVAMGQTGTDVARDASEMVLADDDFTTIVDAVRQGRSIFANIQKFIFFLNSSNAGLVLAVITGSFFVGMPQLTPLQLLWVNLVTNGMPALALGVDPPQADQMLEKPRPLGTGIMGLRDLLGILLVGFIMGLAAFGVMWLPGEMPELFVGDTLEAARLEARTMAFTILAFSPLFHAHNCRSPRSSVVSLGLFTNRYLWLAISISAAVHLLTFLPVMRPVFHTHAMTGAQWGVVLGLSFLPVPIVEVLKLAERMRDA